MRHLMTALAVLALGAGTSAVAAEPNMVVKYDDLDLSSPKAQKTLRQRIDIAARDFCRVDAVRTGSRTKLPAELACISEARAAAREQMASLIESKTLKGG